MKKKLAVAVYQHTSGSRWGNGVPTRDPEIKYLPIGPTGTGKTLLAQRSRASQGAVAIADDNADRSRICR